mmetsp:Transcript_39892/g.100524  ORF Transcript_39892/g.100524 Transcript_39892/m.100524 type:complete len:241 (-) Transcript_39892:80-802(-)
MILSLGLHNLFVGLPVFDLLLGGRESIGQTHQTLFEQFVIRITVNNPLSNIFPDIGMLDLKLRETAEKLVITITKGQSHIFYTSVDDLKHELLTREAHINLVHKIELKGSDKRLFNVQCNVITAPQLDDVGENRTTERNLGVLAALNENLGETSLHSQIDVFTAEHKQGVLRVHRVLGNQLSGILLGTEKGGVLVLLWKIGLETLLGLFLVQVSVKVKAFLGGLRLSLGLPKYSCHRVWT